MMCFLEGRKLSFFMIASAAAFRRGYLLRGMGGNGIEHQSFDKGASLLVVSGNTINALRDILEHPV